MNGRVIAGLIGAARVGIGMALLLAPGMAGKIWLGPPAGRPATRAALRAAGGRDLAIGLGLLRALGSGHPAAGWLGAAAVADSTDGLATLLGYRHLPQNRRMAVTLVALGTAGAEILLAGGIDSSTG